MQIDLTSSIYLMAVIQAIFLITIILRNESVSIAEKYLVAVLIVLSITLLHYVVLINQLIKPHFSLMNISAISWLTVSPLLYLYTRSLVKKNEQWTWRKLIYFPLSIYLLLQIVLVACGFRFGFYLLFDSAETYTTYWIMSYLLNSLCFTTASIYILRKAKIVERQRQKIQWLSWYFRGFAVILLCAIGLLLWSLSTNYFFRQFEFVLLVFYALFIFSLVIFVLRHSNYFKLLSNNQYGNNQKNKLELSLLFDRLKKYVEAENPYLNPNLNLKDLALGIGVTENQLSQLFNLHLNTNFYNFIHPYRLAAFERILLEKGTEQYTIMALAEAAGFASRATFYKVFKAHYGMTPSVYIKQMKCEKTTFSR